MEDITRAENEREWEFLREVLASGQSVSVMVNEGKIRVAAREIKRSSGRFFYRDQRIMEFDSPKEFLGLLLEAGVVT
jgi:hypothetical protein